MKIKATKGFIFLLALFMVFFLFLAGWMFLHYTIQSKNVFNVFFRDDLARFIAESAISEKRVIFEKDLKTSSASLQRLIDCGNMSGPSEQKLEDFTLANLPQTSALISQLGFPGNFTIKASTIVKDIDRVLAETGGVRKKYDKEFQATVQFKLNVGSNFKGHTGNTVFVQEFDLKLVSLRSPPNRPASNGYTTNVTNDYVLFVRDASNEFKEFSGESLNNDKIRLSLRQDATSAVKGKIYFGCPDSDHVFLNIGEDLKKIIPADLPIVTIPWSDIQTWMPNVAQQFQIIKSNAASKGVTIDLAKIEAQISVKHNPISQNPGFWLTLWAKISGLFDSFFNAFQNVNKEKGNKQHGIGIASDNDLDQGICDRMEGKLRQRFWQTSTFKFDLSKLSDDADFQNELKQKESELIRDISYLPQSLLDEISAKKAAGTSLNMGEELASLIDHYQTTENRALMSQGNDRFKFKPGLAQSDQNQDFPEPVVVNKTGSPDISTFLPFSSYLLRSYNFLTSDDFFGSPPSNPATPPSPLMDVTNNTINLKGIIAIGGSITLKKGFKYRGAGVLIALGDINIEGSVTALDPTVDGPFFIYTWLGNINANTVEQGKIEASLIALNWQFSTGARSMVNFNKKKAEVLGNLVADRINLTSMGDNMDNTITYDYQRLGIPQDLYTFFLGGLTRTTSISFDQPEL
ncbi:MAG: hypothetical protein HQM08_21570 [Candidatus Riflebacteria bacterium]|nr:hypothetical protein [Candidatus Riflebacteria bacterium]